jgi:Flp pilus assembly protein TadG
MDAKRPARVMYRMPPASKPSLAGASRRPTGASRTWSALRRHRQSISLGQALVEFALLLPVLMLIFVVALDFGRLFFSYVQVVNAAREAANNAASEARYVQNGTLAASDYYLGIINAANQESNVQGQQGATASLAVSSPDCFTPASASISCDSAPQDSTTAMGIGNSVKVTVTQPFTFLTPLIGDVFGGTLDLSATATAPVLNPLVAKITATATPTATATATPTPTATATATATPTPTPVPNCKVPDYYHTYWADPGSIQTWQNAGFTGTLSDTGDTSKQIQSQSLKAATVVPCTSSMNVSNDPKAYPY